MTNPEKDIDLLFSRIQNKLIASRDIVAVELGLDCIDTMKRLVDQLSITRTEYSDLKTRMYREITQYGRITKDVS